MKKLFAFLLALLVLLAPAVLAHRIVMAVGGKMSESEALIAELCESCRVPIEDR